ncbi:MAG: sulfatase-like hydrolase/transferase [Gemmataceae bacterium]
MHELFIGSLLLVAAMDASPTRPNVLLICVDDLKPVLGCYGDPVVKTPHIDRLAARSIRFDAAYCNQAVCSPSRNALLTGLRPQTLGIYDLGTNFRQSRPGAVTLPQWFKANGYSAQGMGKIFHVGHGNTNDEASWSVPYFRGKVVDYALPENKRDLSREEAMFDNKSPANLPRGAALENADVPDDTYSDGKVAAEAIRRLEAAAKNPDQPLFLAVGFLKPHLPFCAPRKYWDLYKTDLFQLPAVRKAPEGAPAYAPTAFGELRNYKDVPDKGEIPEDLQRKLIHGYHAATSYMDAQVGKVLDALEASPLKDNTIIVLWGDHGWHLGDHGMWSKHTNYEQATRIPLLVRAPGQTNGGASAAMIETVDIYPTLCDLAGLKTPEKLDGISFAPLVNGKSAWGGRDHVTHVFPRGNRLGRAIRTPTHRFVEWKTIGEPAESAELELYDYSADPLERKNLAREQPETVVRMRGLLAKQSEARPQVKGSPALGNDRANLFARRDQNKDGKLTREEFLANQPEAEKAQERFGRFDADKDGVLSRDEFIHQGKIPPAK